MIVQWCVLHCETVPFLCRCAATEREAALLQGQDSCREDGGISMCEKERSVLRRTGLLIKHWLPRCGGLSWSNGDLALLYESWHDTRRSVVWTLAPDRRDQGKEVLFDR